jgi:uncharacterized membrane protein YhdT
MMFKIFIPILLKIIWRSTPAIFLIPLYFEYDSGEMPLIATILLTWAVLRFVAEDVSKGISEDRARKEKELELLTKAYNSHIDGRKNNLKGIPGGK